MDEHEHCSFNFLLSRPITWIPLPGGCADIELSQLPAHHTVTTTRSISLLPPSRRLCNTRHLFVTTGNFMKWKFRLVGWSVAFVCLSHCLFMPNKSQFKSNLHQTGEKLVKFLRLWGQRSRSCHKIVPNLDLWLILLVCLSVCLLATLRKNYWTDLRENFTADLSMEKE